MKANAGLWSCMCLAFSVLKSSQTLCAPETHATLVNRDIVVQIMGEGGTAKTYLKIFVLIPSGAHIPK